MLFQFPELATECTNKSGNRKYTRNRLAKTSVVSKFRQKTWFEKKIVATDPFFGWIWKYKFPKKNVSTDPLRTIFSLVKQGFFSVWPKLPKIGSPEMV